AGGRGSIVDLIRSDAPSMGRQGAGTIHHVAFRAETKAIQREWRERVAAFGLDVTPVIDRQYFESIYFREPGGVLFEIATDPPGFAVDEAQAELGTRHKLPPRYEGGRADIERLLPPIRVPA
ncbi:MAG: VOC family protein, partial [Methyloceanibacter sp.]